MTSGHRSEAELLQKLDEVERSCAATRRDLELQQKVNRRLEDLLNDKVSPKTARRPWIVVGVVVLIVAGFAGWIGYRVHRHAHHKLEAPAVLKPLRPHLAVTSVPSDARVTVDGKAVGKTPLLVDLDPKAQSLVVEVSAPGYKTARRVIEVSAEAGQHWHVALPEQPKNSEPSGAAGRSVEDPGQGVSRP